MKIAVSSYSFAQYIKAGKLTQLSCVKAAHDLGIDAVDFIDLAPEDGMSQIEYAKRIREEADKLGVEVVGYTIGANICTGDDDRDAKEIERLCGQLDIAKILGASILRHDVCYHLFPGKGRSFEYMLPIISKNARAVTEYGEKLGIKTCVENHGHIVQDSDRVCKLIETVHHDNFGMLVDVGNFACADEDSAYAVSRTAQYAFHVHVKDFYKRPFLEGKADGYFQTRGCNYLKGAVIGEGEIPVKQCLAILKKAGYDGALTIEYEGAEDCIESIKRGAENLRKYIAEI